MQNEPQILRKLLPVHPNKREDAGAFVLRVDGLVGHTRELTLSDLELLPQQDVTADFSCEEGWTVRALKWWGVTLESLLALAGAESRSPVGPGKRWGVYRSHPAARCSTGTARN